MMSLINNLKIKNKLILMILFPLLYMAYLSVGGMLEKLKVAQEMESLGDLSVLAIKISSLVHESQKERGVSAGFLGSKGKKFASELQAQRNDTDKNINDLKAFLKDFDPKVYGADFSSQLESTVGKLEQINAKRSAVWSMSIKVGAAIGYYTDLNRSFLNVISRMRDISSNTEISRRVAAYENFLQGKERAGVERAVLANTFAQDTFGTGMYKKFSNLIMEQDTYGEFFLAIANDETRQFYGQTMSDPVVEDVERMRRIAFTAKPKNELTNQLKSKLGYGGLIHLFKNYVLRGSQKYIDRFNRQYEDVGAILDKYSKLAGLSEKGKKDVAIVKDTADKYKMAMETAIDLKSKGFGISEIDSHIKINDGPAINALESMGKGNFGIDPTYWFKTQTGKINLLKKVEDYLSEKLQEKVNYLSSGARSELIFFMISTAVIFIVTIVLSYLMSRSITVPLRKVADTADAMANGNIGMTLDVSGKDEIGGLAESFNRMSLNMKELINSISSSSHHVATSSEQISASAQQMAAGAQSQTMQTEQVATAVEEMSATVLEVAKNSNDASDAAKKATAAARNGGDVVRKTIEGMNRISVSVSESTRTIESLGKNSDEIGEIITVIEDIADQTNLLALNAAIEAARAGEQGRGFAVVADEVRKLAERTTKATKEIASMIKTIQSSTRGAVESMTAGSEEVQKGVEMSNEAGRSLAEIEEVVGSVTDMIHQIATAAEEQSAAAEEISSSIESVSSIANESATGASQSSVATQNLSKQASDLQRMVGKFTVHNS